jgi:hypothetical protein
MFGNQIGGKILRDNDFTIQSLAQDWWVTDNENPFRRGRLGWAFVNYIDKTPMTLIPTREQDSANHNKAEYRLELRKIKEPRPKGILPVAGMPFNEGEDYIVNRSKMRPVLILSDGGKEVDSSLCRDWPKSQRFPTVLVAPFYTARDSKSDIWKFPLPFVEQVKKCIYPNFFWDKLPEGNESILRLAQLQPVGKNPDSFKHTKYCLSQEAIKVIDEILCWLFKKYLPEEDSYIRIFWDLLHDKDKILGPEGVRP